MADLRRSKMLYIPLFGRISSCLHVCCVWILAAESKHCWGGSCPGARPPSHTGGPARPPAGGVLRPPWCHWDCLCCGRGSVFMFCPGDEVLWLSVAADSAVTTGTKQQLENEWPGWCAGGGAGRPAGAATRHPGTCTPPGHNRHGDTSSSSSCGTGGHCHLLYSSCLSSWGSEP